MVKREYSIRSIRGLNSRDNWKVTFMFEGRCYMEAKLQCVLLPFRESCPHIVKGGPQGEPPHPKYPAQVYINYDRIWIHQSGKSKRNYHCSGLVERNSDIQAKKKKNSDETMKRVHMNLMILHFKLLFYSTICPQFTLLLITLDCNLDC